MPGEYIVAPFTEGELSLVIYSFIHSFILHILIGSLWQARCGIRHQTVKDKYTSPFCPGSHSVAETNVYKSEFNILIFQYRNKELCGDELTRAFNKLLPKKICWTK